MIARRAAYAVASIAVAASLAVGAASDASADGLSMLTVLAKYNPVIALAEEHVKVAVEEFKHTANAGPVETALSGSIKVDRVVAIKVVHQPAFSALERVAKAKILVGLAEMVHGSLHIATAYRLIPISGKGAEGEALAGAVLVRKGRSELRAGVKLLG